MIPIIDLSNYFDNPTNCPSVIEAFAYIFKHHGYTIITGHDINNALFSKTTEQIGLFFEMPFDKKVTHCTKQSLLGYIPPKSTLYQSTAKQYKNTQLDLNETFLLAVERDKNDPLIQKKYPYLGPNPWPTSLTMFKQTVVVYQNKMLQLGRKLLPLIAQTLSLQPDYFDNFFNNTMSLNRFSHYPASQKTENQFGIAPHTDHGFITLLPLPEEPGLEILSPNKEWLPIPYVNNGILINVGDFLQIWTNNLYKAPLHRVISPTIDRYSLTFFFNPHPDTLANTLPTCSNTVNPSKPISMLNYLEWYRKKNYQKH